MARNVDQEWLRVSRLVVRTANQTVEHLLTSVVSDDGTILDDEVIERLFLVPATASTVLGLTPPTDAIDAAEAAARKRRLDEADRANADFLAKETDKLDNYADDLEKAADAGIKVLEDEIKAKRKELRTTPGLSVADKVEGQRSIKKLEGQRDELMLSKFQRKKDIRKEVEDLLDSIQASLKLTPDQTPLFTIRWVIRA